MTTAFDKPVLTTGDVARICHVAPRTVSKWVDSGKLRGYRIPGSRDRRIPVDHLISFMRAHGIPTENLDGGLCRLLLVDEQFDARLLGELEATGRYDIRRACNGFEAGMLAQQVRPHVVLLGAEDLDEASAICRNIKAHAHLSGAMVIAIAAGAAEPVQRQRIASCGFDEVVPRPCTLRQLAAAVARMTDLSG